MRGEVYRLRSRRGARGHEQAGIRYVVLVQSDLLPLSTRLVAPTSTSARGATFRPEVSIEGRPTRVLAEQTSAVDPQRLGKSAGLDRHLGRATIDYMYFGPIGFVGEALCT